jgi:hypothetical protein
MATIIRIGIPLLDLPTLPEGRPVPFDKLVRNGSDLAAAPGERAFSSVSETAGPYLGKLGLMVLTLENWP